MRPYTHKRNSVVVMIRKICYHIKILTLKNQIKKNLSQYAEFNTLNKHYNNMA